MKNIIIVSELKGGGVEKVNIQLASNLSKEKYDVCILSIIGRGYKEVNVNCPCYNLACKSESKAFFKIIKFFKQKSPDIIITVGNYSTYSALIYKKLFNKNTKIIYVQHSVYGMNINKKNKIQLLIHHKLATHINLYNKCDKVIFVSKGVEEDFSKYYRIDLKKKSIIYNPVIDYNINIEKKKVGKYINLITVGRIEEEKNQIYILEALNILIKDRIKVKLKIVGEGSLKNKLIEYCIKNNLNDYVEFLGYKNNVYEIIKKSDIFILSSKHESFGNVLIESMYSGTPVISTDCPYGPKEILKNNQYGYLVDLNNVNELVEKIKLISSNDNKDLINRARLYSENFTVENSILKYEEIIDNL